VPAYPNFKFESWGSTERRQLQAISQHNTIGDEIHWPEINRAFSGLCNTKKQRILVTKPSRPRIHSKHILDQLPSSATHHHPMQ
jgi:hypothetical protein